MLEALADGPWPATPGSRWPAAFGTHLASFCTVGTVGNPRLKVRAEGGSGVGIWGSDGGI
jgi:hypothetical protein